MASENETVEDVLRVMRDAANLDQSAIDDNNHLLTDWFYDDECQGWLTSFADRFESAWRREKAQVMQEATEVAMAPTHVQYEPRPRRNCDRFKNEDEADFHYRKEHNTAYAPAGDFIRWLFAPVAEGGSKK